MSAPPAGFTEATFRFNYTGVTREITWTHGFAWDDFTVAPPSEMAQILRTHFTDTGAPYAPANMMAGWVFKGVTVTKMLESGPVSGEYLQNSVGTASGTSVPINSAVLIRKQTDAGGRRNRGRMYAPSSMVTETNIDGAGFLGSGNVLIIQNTFDTAWDALADGHIFPVLYHNEAPFTPTPVTSWVVQGQLATQRRRMRK